MKTMKPAGTQHDKGLGFDGAEIVSARKPSQAVVKNQWSGHSNDGRTVNMGRGPTKGNDGSCHHSGMAQGGKKPPVAALAGKPANSDSIRVGSQQRGAGGVAAKSPANPDRINAGRGPVKGNQQ